MEQFEFNFDINHHKAKDVGDEDVWAVLTIYCQIGGCEQADYAYNSQFNANRKAVQGRRRVSHVMLAILNTCSLVNNEDVLHVELTIHYQIKLAQLEKYLYNVHNKRTTIKQIKREHPS
ncbi:hypothetical protein [Sporosarcina sp. FSL K6-1508]|uniref:hypothetical protein n=1 Tax=Sporosarcina sp. FSL K6-1508 TaxID=2921553 RepID=UPI0030F8E47C